MTGPCANEGHASRREQGEPKEGHKIEEEERAESQKSYRGVKTGPNGSGGSGDVM